MILYCIMRVAPLAGSVDRNNVCKENSGIFF